MKYSNRYFNNIYLHNIKIKYPLIDDQHMIIYPRRYTYIYDKDFAYRLKDKWNKFLGFWLRLIVLLIGIPATRIMYGLRIKGKENIKKYYALNNGRKAMISVCNHVAVTDFIMVSATRHRVPTIPMWQEGAESKHGMTFRRTLGLVVPKKDNLKGIMYSFREMKEVIKEDKWLHIYPEAACWPHYPCLRGFHRGTFSLAQEFDLPVLPMAISFREPKGLYRLFKKNACATITIGEPVLTNKELDRPSAIDDLKDRVYQSMLHLLNFKDDNENQQIRKQIYNIKND